MNIALFSIISVVALILIIQAYIARHTLKLCAEKNEFLLPIERSPETMIIVFDLHGVLFRHNYKKMLLLFFKSKKKWQLTWALLNPKIWFDVLQLARDCTVPEAFIMRLAQHHTAIKELLPTIIMIMNAQLPDAQTVELVHALKYKGYQLHIISNIGETIYHDLKQQFPEVLSVFDNVLVTCAANGYISKPNPQVYYTYLESIDQAKKPLFVDDKVKNITSALSCGIASVYYRSSDQAHKMIKEILNMPS